MIVFDDADLKNAVKGALMANFFTQVGRTQKDAFFDANGTNNKSIYTILMYPTRSTFNIAGRGVLEWDKNIRPAGNLRLFPFRICQAHTEAQSRGPLW